MTEKELNNLFNKVHGIIAVCQATKSWMVDYSDVLVVGKTYKVAYIGVFRSSTKVILEETGYREFNSACFDFFEFGYPTDIVDDYRLTAPYLRQMYEEIGTRRNWKLKNSKGTIRPHLRDIEKRYDISILCAVLSGSRLRGWETPNSDWDIHFIYKNPSCFYKQDHKADDALEEVYADNVDMMGWDLKNFLIQLAKGNPICYELIKSPKYFRYNSKFNENISNLAEKYFQPINAIYYYFNSYLLNERFIVRDKTDLKKSLYALNGLLSCLWVEKHHNLPPYDFRSLVEDTVYNETIKNIIDSLLNARKNSNETIINIQESLANFIYRTACTCKNLVGDFKPKDVSLEKCKDLFDFFHEMIKE